MENSIRMAIIGAGRIGTVHATHLKHRIVGAELVALSDIYEPSMLKLAASLDISDAYLDHRRILERDDIDAVVICSSTDTHAALITEAAQAGKHIFCEKPIALELNRIDAALAVVRKAGVKLQVGFNRRFDPHFSAVHDAVAAGQIGTPEMVRITSRDPAPPPLSYIKVSGGIFMDMTIHDFDMARFLVDSPIEEVYAAGGVLVDPEIGAAGDIDTAIITLCYANGALGVIENSRRAVYGYDQRAEVFGSLGMVSTSNATPHSAVVSNAEGTHAALPLFFFLERYVSAYVAEMQAFVEAIRKDKPTQVTGWDARIPVVMGYAAWKSYREHRPVKLSEIDGATPSTIS